MKIKTKKRINPKEVTIRDPRVKKLAAKIRDCEEAIDQHRDHIEQIRENLELILEDKKRYIAAIRELGFDW